MTFENSKKVDRNTSFQVRLGSVKVFLGVKRLDDTNPDAPNISPESNNNKPADKPMYTKCEREKIKETTEYVRRMKE